MNRWFPLRKIAAVAITAAVSFAGFAAWVAGAGTLDWRGLVGAVVVAVAPALVGYLTPAAATLPPGGEEI